MKDDGGPAFPMPFTAVAGGDNVTLTVPYPGDVPTGMSQRAWLAGTIAAGIRASESQWVELCRGEPPVQFSTTSTELAKRAIADADAIIAELGAE